MLVERYNHLGGLSTGGLVIWIDRMSDWTGKQVIAGLARDIFDRLPKEAVMGPCPLRLGLDAMPPWPTTGNRAPLPTKASSPGRPLSTRKRSRHFPWSSSSSPTSGPSFTPGPSSPSSKTTLCAARSSKAKKGRQAILAKVVVDTTGDADLLARARMPLDSDIDAQDIHHCINTAFLLGGVDLDRWLTFRREDAAGFSAFLALGRETLGSFEKPFCGWRDDVALFMGPRLTGYSAVNVEDLTEVEIRSRELTVRHLEFYRRHAPGFDQAFLMLGAPQIGVRHSRRLTGERKVTRAQWDEGKVWDDEIGVSTSLSPKFPNISVPYGSLVPVGIDGVLGAGRHVACDASSHSFLREVPQCWLTGQAAGVAAALAAGSATQPRALSPIPIQDELLRQGAYLSPSIETAVRRQAPRPVARIRPNRPSRSAGGS